MSRIEQPLLARQLISQPAHWATTSPMDDAALGANITSQ